MRDESSDEAPEAPEAPETGGHFGEMGPPHRPACDQCRHRKIGCDRDVPCSNCTRAGIECKFTSSQRPKVRRQRVLISAQYERKIDAIEESLDQVIRLLGRLTTQAPSSGGKQPVSSTTQPAQPPVAVRTPSTNPVTHPDANTASSTPSAATPKNRNAANTTPAAAVFEGDSSLHSQTAFANTFVENAIRNGPLRLEMRDALAALRNMVETRGQDNHLAAPGEKDTVHDGSHSPDPEPVPPRLRPMPPVELAMQTVRIAQEDRRLSFVIFGCIMNLELFTSYLIRVYYPGDYTDADFIIVNSCLYTLFTERLILEHDPRILEELAAHIVTTKDNFETALSALPLVTPATMDYVLALALGASVAIDTSSIALSSAATNSGLYLAQTLGYHRQQTMIKDSPQTRDAKIWLFWMLYILDKGISLRLGRPATAQDYDITIPIPEAIGDPTRDHAMAYTLIRWIKVAQLQGEVYRLLYSPGAGILSQSELSARARSLVTNAHAVFADVYAPTEQMKQHYAYWKGILPLFMLEMCDRSDEVLYMTLLTLILRAVPVEPGSPASFVDECVAAARQALEKHGETVSVIRPQDAVLLDTYVKWTILYSPFLPFIVIFCHCIETSDQSDLQLLTDFVTSLSGPASSSDATASQYRLFSMLETVARRYLELKAAAEAKSPETSMTPVTANVARNEIDGYLHALGIVPALQAGGDMGMLSGPAESMTAMATPMTTIHGGEGSTKVQNQPSLEDWFYNGQQLMGLWEENLF